MDRCVLITGASRGIGAQIARRFAKEGWSVVVNYNRHEEEAMRLVSELNGTAGFYRAGKVIPAKADVSDRAQVEAMFSLVRQAYGKVDVLINNAGVAQQKLFTDLTAEDWDHMMAVDVTGVFHCCQCALPDMIRAKSGRIINISSMWGQVGASCEVHYSAAKAAVIGLTKALSKEVGPSGIQVNCIAPGVIQTEMNGKLSPETLDSLKEETPLGVLGKASDIAGTAWFLASEDAGFITGQVIGVNGGIVV